MTHISKFRYGTKIIEPPSDSRGCSEVRVSYFDPATGRPCKEKPKPLGEHGEGKGSLEQNKKRKPKDKKECFRRRTRAVLVDGERFESITAAARVLGVSASYLSKQLSAGAKRVHGRKVEIAEVSR